MPETTLVATMQRTDAALDDGYLKYPQVPVDGQAARCGLYVRTLLSATRSRQVR